MVKRYFITVKKGFRQVDQETMAYETYSSSELDINQAISFVDRFAIQEIEDKGKRDAVSAAFRSLKELPDGNYPIKGTDVKVRIKKTIR